MVKLLKVAKCCINMNTWTVGSFISHMGHIHTFSYIYNKPEFRMSEYFHFSSAWNFLVLKTDEAEVMVILHREFIKQIFFVLKKTELFSPKICCKPLTVCFCVWQMVRSQTQALKRDLSLTTEAGALQENIKKNRYKDILPCRNTLPSSTSCLSTFHPSSLFSLFSSISLFLFESGTHVLFYN